MNIEYMIVLLFAIVVVNAVVGGLIWYLKREQKGHGHHAWARRINRAA